MYHHQLEKLSRTRLDDVLLDEGLLDRETMDRALAQTTTGGKTLARVLTTSAVLDDWDLAKIIATHYSLPFVDISDYSLQREVIELLDPEFCTKHSLIPLDRFGAVLSIAVSEMPSTDVLRDLAKQTELTPFFYVGVRRQIAEALEREYLRSGRRKPTKAAESKPAAAPEPKQDEEVPVETGRLKMQTAAEALFAGMASDDAAAGAGAAPTPSFHGAQVQERVPLSGIEPVSMLMDAHVTVGSGGSKSSTATARRPRVSTPTPAAAQGPQDTAWESIFDLGDNAVKND